MAAAAGLPVELVDALAGHSTRVGAVQDMIASGIELPAILQAGRWKNTLMVQRYGERLLAKRGAAARLARIAGPPMSALPGTGHAALRSGPNRARCAPRRIRLYEMHHSVRFRRKRAGKR